jgi:hypothetical protein
LRQFKFLLKQDWLRHINIISYEAEIISIISMGLVEIITETGILFSNIFTVKPVIAISISLLIVKI